MVDAGHSPNRIEERASRDTCVPLRSRESVAQVGRTKCLIARNPVQPHAHYSARGRDGPVSSPGRADPVDHKEVSPLVGLGVVDFALRKPHTIHLVADRTLDLDMTLNPVQRQAQGFPSSSISVAPAFR